MTDLFTQAAATDFAARAIMPARELGAYEFLWAQRGTTFKSLAELFRQHPGTVPSDFVSPADTEHYARLALGHIRNAGIEHFGIRVYGAGEYPEKLRAAEHPLQLLYFQGKVAEAIPHLRAAIENQPSLSKIQGILGIAELRTQDFARGRNDLEASFPLIEDKKFKDITYSIVGTYHDDDKGLNRFGRATLDPVGREPAQPQRQVTPAGKHAHDDPTR